MKFLENKINNFFLECVDLAPANQCSIIRNTRGWCEAYPKSCRRTCGQCKPCAIPEPELKCTIGKNYTI